ncbi:MAG: iron-containing redox enzyme family protein [Thermodesulfobacteriota bacterium]|jgi:pyrroloquinoline quinone (PQQ) biosynthesis protein C
MSRERFSAALQREIDPLQQRLIDHPLNQGIFTGTLPLPVLREYAKQAYLWKRYAQDLLPVLIPKAPDDVRRLLIKNLVSEEGLGEEPPHLQLLIEFGEEIGLRAEDFFTAEPILEVDALCNFYARVFYGGTIVEAAAAFNFAFEGLLAREYPKIAAALRRYYRIGPKGLRFWDIHVEADAEHSGDGAVILDTYATTAELQAKARRAAKVGLEHRYVAMEGIYRRFGAA